MGKLPTMSDLHDVAERPATSLADVKKHLPGEPKLAEAQAREYLKANPDDPEGKMLLGAALRLKGMRQARRKSWRRSCRTIPIGRRSVSSSAWRSACSARTTTPIRVLTEAVNIDRNLSPAWSALGEQYVLIGDILASDAAYSHHFNVAVNEPALQKA